MRRHAALTTDILSRVSAFSEMAMIAGRALEIMAGEVDTAIDPRCFAALQAVVEDGIPENPLVQISGAMDQVTPRT